jgi:hypothetical protein
MDGVVEMRPVQDQVVAVVIEQAQGLGPILGCVDGMAVAAKDRRHGLTKSGLVINDEDAIHGRDSFPSGDRT